LLATPALGRASDGDWFLLTGDHECASSNPKHPAYLKLQQLGSKDQQDLTCVAFTPHDDWILLFGANGAWTSDAQLPVCKKLAELQKANALKCVAFTPQGGWVILYGENGYFAHDLPRDAVARLKEVASKDGTLRSIAFTLEGGWVILGNDSDVWMSGRGVPEEAAKKLREYVKRGVAVRCVSFSTRGDWFLLDGDNGCVSSSADHPALKKLQAAAKRDQTLKWVAFSPGEAPAGYVLRTEPAGRIKAVLTTEIIQPSDRVQEWYLYAPQPPDGPSQREVHSTLAPGGKAVKESSSLKQPVWLSRVTGQPRKARTVLTVEAVLCSRRLWPRQPGAAAPAVKDLNGALAQLYTRPSATLDFKAAVFQEWLQRFGLRRGKKEAEAAFARRVFQFIKGRYSYRYRADQDRHVSFICRQEKSDCSGLCGLFVAVLRANQIPARLLQGRWAKSEKPGATQGGSSYSQWHVKAEFFARGVGWVPVDLAGAVLDSVRGEFAYFGNDPGDFLVLHVDQDLGLNSFVQGKQTLFGLQGVYYWWRGTGQGNEARFQEKWVVEKQAPKKGQ
jgi:transglutaminase-like putative cysteine protease